MAFRSRLAGVVVGLKRRMGVAEDWPWSRLSWPNLFNVRTPERLGIIYTAQTHLSIAEKLFIYAFVRGCRPGRVLEIGSHRGGSASIMASAMADAGGEGVVVCLDPQPLFHPQEAIFHGRVRLVRQMAPEGLAAARELAGGSFDLIFYDGPNIFDLSRKIIEAASGHLADGGYLLVDNGMHYGLQEAVRQLMGADPRLHDCGFPCVTPGVYDPWVAYNGLRLLRFSSSIVADPQPYIERTYSAAAKIPPKHHRDVLNHDMWYCRAVSPCVRCREAREQPSGG